MATVYITKELTRSVKDRINKMRDREVELEVPDHEKNITADASELLMQMAWGDYKHVCPQLPKEWLKHNKTQDVNVLTAEDEHGKSEKYCFTIAGLQHYYEPPTVDRWSGPRPTCTKVWLETKLHLTGSQDMLDRLAQKEIRTTIYAKWQKANDDVQMFLNKCKSLNEALRLWPALKLYISDEYMNRINTKVERRKRETEIIESVDTEELTASAIAARLSGVV